MLIQDRSMPAREETSYGFIASTARHASFSCSTTLRSPIANATHQNHFLLRATSNLIDTHVDENLGATERQMSGRKMLPDLGGVHPTVLLHSRDVKRSTVRLLPTFDGLRLEFLKIQLVAERDPSYRAVIADKHFELSELISKLSS